MKRICTSIYERQIKELKQISTEEVKFSEHIRRAIEEYLHSYEKSLHK